MLEDREPDGVLDRFNLLADRGLGPANFRRGCGHAARAVKDLKRQQMPEGQLRQIGYRHIRLSRWISS
jgi:hypothetical protein